MAGRTSPALANLAYLPRVNISQLEDQPPPVTGPQLSAQAKPSAPTEPIPSLARYAKYDRKFRAARRGRAAGLTRSVAARERVAAWRVQEPGKTTKVGSVSDSLSA
jgi:hypothetical protein